MQQTRDLNTIEFHIALVAILVPFTLVIIGIGLRVLIPWALAAQHVHPQTYELETFEQEQPVPQPEAKEYLADGDREAERQCGRTRPWGLPHFANHPYRARTPTPEYDKEALEYTASVAQVIR
ncbi:hypothetical protein EDD18DRAFT_1344564 [Armillaria luteobubalina]|uniref:Uncharacterized protein n=1 Tax=Armillaria luteobubalina TaxID=153913 RepID=A0AA39UUF1_9AGAR|nr:hypothetical protein EDD18DRAFT_1344564 [Armillaria luteobubalina]